MHAHVEHMLCTRGDVEALLGLRCSRSIFKRQQCAGVATRNFRTGKTWQNARPFDRYPIGSNSNIFGQVACSMPAKVLCLPCNGLEEGCAVAVLPCSHGFCEAK